MQPSGVLTADIPYTARFLWLTIQELQAQSPGGDGAQISHEALSRIIGRGRRQVIRLCDILESKGFLRVTRAARNSHVTNVYHAQIPAQMSHSANAVDSQMSHSPAQLTAKCHTESVVVDSIQEGVENHESKQMVLQNKQQRCDIGADFIRQPPGESAQRGETEGAEPRREIDPVVVEVFHQPLAAQMAAKYGADRVKMVCAAAKNRRNPGGWARSALEQMWQIPLPLVYEQPQKESWSEYAAQINADSEARWQEREVQRREEAERKRQEEAQRAARQTMIEVAAGCPEAQQWEAAYGQLELQLDRASFNAWLKGAQFAGIDGETYLIVVKNAYARDMCQHRLYRNIRRALRDVTGRAAELRFVAAGDAAGSPMMAGQEKARPEHV